jgi:bifunctional non-homologous end joining protein LigD
VSATSGRSGPLTIRAGRRRVDITRPDKPLFPCGITKAELAGYYERVAPAMLSHIRSRPLNLERYPNGIEGERIIQQRASGHFPAWIKRATVGKKGGAVEHVVAGDAATLVYLAGQACITFHPWLSRRDSLNRPDRLIFDLDPSSEDPAGLRRAARTMAELLRELGLEPWVMTTGSRGYHLTIPLQRRADFDSVRRFARGVAMLAAAREPRVFTIEARKAKRGRAILIDIMRNAYAHTAVAPYSVRPRPGGPVATPLHLSELEEASTRSERWTLRTVLDRLERHGDPWAGISRHPMALGDARRRLEEALGEAGADYPR